ncbi:Ferrous-iron efflux pump FieF [Thalassocella blandensis]|nr:Ferrous-iron efflux pump FieF [Thalassocella blandensis]
MPDENLITTTSSHEKSVRRVLLVEGMANILVLAIKLIIGFSTGSLAILSDAIHSLTDVANNIVAWTIVKFSYKPPDRNHPYGHRKFETLAVFFLATLLTLLAFQLVLQVFNSEDRTVSSRPWEIMAMLGVLLINITVSIWERTQALKLNSDILLADASHTFSDTLTTIAVIIGWLVSSIGFAWVDKACALVVAGIVFYLAFELFKKASPILVDEFAFEPEKIYAIIHPVANVKNIKDIRSRYLGQDALLDLVIEVEPSLSVKQANDVVLATKKVLQQQLGEIDITIRVEPYDPS